MHNEVIWIVKDGQRVQVGAWVHDKLFKFLPQFLTVMLNAVIVDIQETRAKNGGNAFLLRVTSVAKRKCDL